MDRAVSVADFDSINAITSRLRIFGGVTDVQRETLFRKLELRVLEKGDAVFRKGDAPSGIYVVKAGRIDLQITENDVVIHKHSLNVGECFGEASFISMHAHTSTASAAENGEIIVLSRRALIELKHEDIELFALLVLNLARELARRLYLTDQMLLDVTARQSAAR